MRPSINQEENSSADYGEDMDFDPADTVHKIEIKRKLDARMEKRRLKQELEDYEGELDDFDWNGFDKE